jgi:hypothetical protein
MGNFMASMAVAYLLEAVWCGFHLGQWKPLARFGWMAVGVALFQILLKAAAWAASF